MNVQDLDRLVSKTELTPTSKLMLKTVRKSLMRGRVKGPMMTDYTWTVVVQDFGQQGARFSFKLKKDPHEPS